MARMPNARKIPAAIYPPFKSYNKSSIKILNLINIYFFVYYTNFSEQLITQVVKCHFLVANGRICSENQKKRRNVSFLYVT